MAVNNIDFRKLKSCQGKIFKLTMLLVTCVHSEYLGLADWSNYQHSFTIFIIL